MENRKQIIFDDYTDGNSYVVVYHLGYEESDDSFDETETVEIELKATDFDTALKYAQQYLRKMKTEEDSADTWSNAEIISIEQY